MLVATCVFGAEPAPEVGRPAEAPSEPVWLGVLLGDAVDGGVQVVALVPSGPAANAGVQIGDVILSVNENATPDRSSLGRAVSGLRPGQHAKISILRENKPLTREVEVARRSDSLSIPPLGSSSASPGALAWSSGISVVSIPRELRLHYGAPAEAGALVTSIDAGSAAANADVRVGDVLVRVDGTAIRDGADLVRAIVVAKGGTRVPVSLVRNRKPIEVSLAAGPTVSFPSGLSSEALILGADVSTDERIRTLEAEVERLERRIRELEERLEQAPKD